MSGVRRFILAAVTVGILAILFVQITAPLIGAIGTGGQDATLTAQDAVPILSATGSVESGGGESADNIRNVRSTLGDAVQLTGANDSQVDIQASPEIDGSHEVCTFASADSAAVSNNEVRVLYHITDMVLYYNGTSDRYEAWYYDDGSREAAIVGVAASDASSRTLVCGQVNASTSTLTIFRNTTQGASESLNGSASADAPPDNNWDGSLDETRIYNRTLNSSQRSELNSTPALAVTGDAAALRITYDSFQPSPGSVETFFASGGADLSNATLTAGVSGPSLSAGSDFTTDGDTITVVGSGQLDDNGEVLYADYDKTDDAKAAAIDAVSTATEMIPVLVIALVSAGILLTVRRFNG